MPAQKVLSSKSSPSSSSSDTSSSPPLLGNSKLKPPKITVNLIPPECLAIFHLVLRSGEMELEYSYRALTLVSIDGFLVVGSDSHDNLLGLKFFFDMFGQEYALDV